MGETLSPEFIGCVMTCLSGSGVADQQTVALCLAGCYVTVHLADEGSAEEGDEEGEEGPVDPDGDADDDG